jgi:hypothetical protein
LGGSEGAFFADPFFGVNAVFDQDYRIGLPLIAGETYTLMVANTSFGTTGDYTVGIISDNGGVLNGFGAANAVEVDLPLFCGDLDLVEILGEQT